MAFNYPDTRQTDHVDHYHGVKVLDPYRWLEADPRESEEVAAWIAAQNEVTCAHLHAIEARAAVKRRDLP